MSNANIVTRKKSKGAGCLRWLGRAALGFLSLVLVAVAIGASYQAIASAGDAKLYKPVDQMVDVNGVQMRLDCRGSGSPTVILEAGAQSWSTHWALVQDDVAQFTRVCSYDRAGYGWSEPVDEEINPKQVAKMLHTLLENGGEKPPYLMVGHSFGGVIVRTFTAEYPDEVVGMVLVDSSHENQFQQSPPEIEEISKVQVETSQTSSRINQIAERLGYIRAFKLYDAAFASLQFPEKDEAALLVEMYRTGYFAAIAREVEVMIAYCRQPCKLNSLGDMPLIVLSAEKNAQEIYDDWAKWAPLTDPPSQISMEMAQQWADTLSGFQDELVALSTQGKRIDVKESGHNIHMEKPQAVIDAVREVFEQVSK
jgi:pimeloyl-ACP methyl ester carboxylesterase